MLYNAGPTGEKSAMHRRFPAHSSFQANRYPAASDAQYLPSKSLTGSVCKVNTLARLTCLASDRCSMIAAIRCVHLDQTAVHTRRVAGTEDAVGRHRLTVL